MVRRFQWPLIALAALVLLLAWWLDQRRPFLPLLRNSPAAGRLAA